MKKIYVSFHIGRGGHFNNQGHLTFRGEYDFQDLINICSDVLMFCTEDEEGKPLPDEQWQLVDTGSNVILEGREAIEAKTGYLNFDEDYNTDYTTTTDDLSERETDAIWKAYKNGEYMSDELKAFVRSEKSEIDDNKEKQLFENYDQSEQECSFKEYVEMEAANDPDFFRWLFDDDNLEDFENPNEEEWNRFFNNLDE